MKAKLHKEVEKYLNRLNAKDRERIDDVIEDLEKEPPKGDIEPIAGQPRHFRTRVGSYRLLWRIKENFIFITHIDPRGQVYKKRIRGIKDDSNRIKKRITYHY